MKLKEVKKVYSDLDRIKIIADLVSKGSYSPRIKSLANDILNSYGVIGGMEDMNRPEFQKKELEAIFTWVRDNITYRNDPYGTDAYHTAERILDLGYGDCDDMTILLDSLLSSVGWKTGCRIVSSHPDKPFHHIYSIVVFPKYANINNGSLIPMDPTIKYFKVGDQVKFAKKRDFLFL